MPAFSVIIYFYYLFVSIIYIISHFYYAKTAATLEEKHQNDQALFWMDDYRVTVIYTATTIL